MTEDERLRRIEDRMPATGQDALEGFFGIVGAVLWFVVVLPFLLLRWFYWHVRRTSAMFPDREETPDVWREGY